MAFGRTRVMLPNFEITIGRVEFEIQKEKVNGKRVGQARFTYSTLDRLNSKRSSDIEVRLPALSIWADPDKQEVVKAHLKIDPQNLESVHFYRDLCKRAKSADCSGYGPAAGMTMIASSQLVMRYGKPGTSPYATTQEDYSTRNFYDSKSAAIQAILRDMQSRNLRNIGGISVASFTDVPEELLQQVGFIRVPDSMEAGIPMWAGDPAIFKEVEGSSWNTQAKAKLDLLLDTFLGGLQKALQAA